MEENKKNHESNFETVFHINQPNKQFKKSLPPDPDFNILTDLKMRNGKLMIPSLVDFVRNSENKVQVYAFADEANDPLYYSFNFNYSLPFIVKD